MSGKRSIFAKRYRLLAWCGSSASSICHSPLPVAHSLLPVSCAHCLSAIAYCQEPVAYCEQPIAHCSLSSASTDWPVLIALLSDIWDSTHCCPFCDCWAGLCCCVQQHFPTPCYIVSSVLRGGGGCKTLLNSHWKESTASLPKCWCWCPHGTCACPHACQLLYSISNQIESNQVLCSTTRASGWFAPKACCTAWSIMFSISSWTHTWNTFLPLCQLLWAQSEHQGWPTGSFSLNSE